MSALPANASPTAEAAENAAPFGVTRLLRQREAIGYESFPVFVYTDRH